MTGQKDRYSTTEKLWKLDDEQLTTPRHDELVIDILSKGKEIFKKYGNPFTGSNTFCITKYYKSGYMDKINLNEIPNGEKKILVNESAYRSKWNVTLNFDDYNVLLNKSKDNLNSLLSEPIIRSEVPLKAKNGFLIGYLDVLLETPKIEDTWFVLKEFDIDGYIYKLEQTININSNSLGIEVKPTITSFGQTLRQLNTYREYFDGKLILYTDDLRFKDAFESQEIQVVSP